MNKNDFISENGYADAVRGTVLPYLEKRRESGFTGGGLYYERYAADAPRRTVVMLHGFTESVPKLYELAYYFLLDGGNVCMLEQRGHGRSARYVEDKTLTHIDRFGRYVDDLEEFVENHVPKELPLMLFAHSMGGAVGSLYMERHPDAFAKAALSSPMIAPQRGGFPLFAAKLICYGAIALGKEKKRIFLSSEYPGKERLEDSCATSQARFDYYEDLRVKTPEFHNYSPTYRWTLESLKVTAKILRRSAPERVNTEVLLLQAGLDNAVRDDAQEKFVSRLPHAKLYRFEKAKHEIFRSTDEVAEPYFMMVTEFFNR